MPIFRLDDEIIFPPARLAEDSGVLAVGGDLSPRRLIEAYRNGIFPWYSEGDPVIWWSPDPRFVLYPKELKVSRTMRQTLSRKVFEITLDKNFREVVEGCRGSEARRNNTWITDEMVDAYCMLHRLGYAHSVEAYQGGRLVGGLYGVSLGKCFFGESMYFTVSNASKAALIVLVRMLEKRGFLFVDCQVHTEHLETLGARYVPRDEYLAELERGLRYETITGDWGALLGAEPCARESSAKD